MSEFIVIDGHAPWCAYIRSLGFLDNEEECDCRGWDDDDPCHCAPADWAPHTRGDHIEDDDGLP